MSSGNDKAPSVPPEHLAGYLRAGGWVPLPETWRGSLIWASDEFDERLVFPPDIEYRDDAMLVRHAIDSLAKAEDRPTESLFRDIELRLVDRQTFRTHPETPSGSIPIKAGAAATSALSSAFTAAAQWAFAEESGPPPGPADRRVKIFLDRVRLGPSVPGSYQFTTEVGLTPGSPPRSEEPDLLDSRLVLISMRRSLSAALAAARVTAAQRRGDFGAFEDAQDDGVSAKLCDSLAGLAAGADRPFEILFSWAPGRPMESGPEDEMEFSSGYGRIFKQAAKHLSSPENLGEVQFVGEIIGLERDSVNHLGIARVRGLLTSGRGERRRTLRMRLDHADYDQALIAHQRGTRITATGRMSIVAGRQELAPTSIDFGM